jgi:hypothetical protein
MLAKIKKLKGQNVSKKMVKKDTPEASKKDIKIKKDLHALTKSKNIMTMKEIAEKAKKEVADLTGFKSPSLVGAKKDGGGWILSIELVEKNSIPEGMDILGLYEVKTDMAGDIVNYKRKSSRRRSDIIEGGITTE